MTDITDKSNFAEALVEHVSERLCSDPRIESCELTPNDLEVTKRELVETKLYCPLKFMIEEEDCCDLIEVDSANYVDYDFEINEHIREDLNSDEYAVKRGLAAYFCDENLDKKVYSIAQCYINGAPNKFCVKKNKALPISQDLRQGKI